MDLRQLRHFVAVADAGSFTAAAAELNMSQPALSQSISKLERILGTVLLDRNRHTNSGVTLTPAGRSLYRDGRALVAAAQRTVERARRAGTSSSRLTVAIGFTSSTPQSLVNNALAVGDRHPAVDIIPVQLEWGHEHEAVPSGIVDIAYLLSPASAVFPGHEVRRVASVALVAVFAATHPLAEQPSVTLRQLAGEKLLDPGFESGPTWFRDLWLGLPRPHGFPIGEIVGPPARTVEEMFNLVAAGRGMAIASSAIIEVYQRRDLVFLPVTDLPLAQIGLARLADDDRDPITAIYDEMSAVVPAGRSILEPRDEDG